MASSHRHALADGFGSGGDDGGVERLGKDGVFGLGEDAEFFFGAGIADQSATVVSESLIGCIDGSHYFRDFLEGRFLADRHINENLGILGHTVGEFGEGISRLLEEGQDHEGADDAVAGSGEVGEDEVT